VGTSGVVVSVELHAFVRPTVILIGRISLVDCAEPAISGGYKRHDRAVFAFGDSEHEGGVWAKVYPTDPQPSFQAFVELYKATGV